MKFAVAATLFTLAFAQTRDDIPECGLKCIDDAIKSSTDCATDDYACVCPKLDSIQGAAAGCVLAACGSDVALNKVLPAAQALCAAQGTKPASTSAPAETTPAETTPAETTPAETTPAETSAAPTEHSSAPATTVAPHSTSAAVPVDCDTTTMVSQTHAGNNTVPTTMPVAAGAAGLSAGVAAIALAALAL